MVRRETEKVKRLNEFHEERSDETAEYMRGEGNCGRKGRENGGREEGRKEENEVVKRIRKLGSGLVEKKREEVMAVKKNG